jgi:hypothetical protein
MSIKIYDVECDECQKWFATDDVFNVEFADNTMCVYCSKCLDVASMVFELVDVWKSKDR